MPRAIHIFVFVIIGAIAVWCGWLALVIAYQAKALAYFPSGTLEEAGQFGDAFGVVASFMTTLAASAAFVAFWNQREEGKIREFENHLFTLLQNFQTMISEVDVKRSFKSPSGDELDFLFAEVSGEVHGRDAARALVLMLRKSISRRDGYKDSKVVERIYRAFYDKWHDDLGHYFRTIYHIFKMIDERCPGDKKYYARLVRAHLCNSELCLIAYNCSVGEGRFKFKKLAEEYAIFHNIHINYENAVCISEISFFMKNIGQGAFCFEENDKFKYS